MDFPRYNCLLKFGLSFLFKMIHPPYLKGAGKGSFFVQTPFLDAILLLKEKGGRFHVPGHKGNPAALPFFADSLPFDLTEIEGADNLSSPAGPLAESEKNMARAYGAGASLYSAGGSTSCVQAMLSLFVKEGERVVLTRNSHVSALRALAFLGAEGVFLLPDEEGGLSCARAEEALAQTGAKALYVTSPDYEGRLCDIAGLAAVCKRQGAKLLVDGAHGAHLLFFGLHPIALGADAVAESAHKTLPALTPAAVLHLKEASLGKAGREALNLFTSTSPSYPVLCSLDHLAGLLCEGDLAPLYRDAAEKLALAAEKGAAMKLRGVGDPCKLTLIPALAGYTAAEAAAALRSKGIEPELVTNTTLVLMATPYNTKADFAALEEALEALPPKKPLACPLPRYETPPRAVPLRQAVLGRRETVLVSEAAGRVAAGLVAPCPPGIPVVLPGEIFTPNLQENLVKSGILTVEVLL